MRGINEGDSVEGILSGLKSKEMYPMVSLLLRHLVYLGKKLELYKGTNPWIESSDIVYINIPKEAWVITDDDKKIYIMIDTSKMTVVEGDYTVSASPVMSIAYIDKKTRVIMMEKEIADCVYTFSSTNAGKKLNLNNFKKYLGDLKFLGKWIILNKNGSNTKLADGLKMVEELIISLEPDLKKSFISSHTGVDFTFEDGWLYSGVDGEYFFIAINPDKIKVPKGVSMAKSYVKIAAFSVKSLNFYVYISKNSRLGSAKGKNIVLGDTDTIKYYLTKAWFIKYVSRYLSVK